MVFSRDIAFFILEAALVFSRNIVFFFFGRGFGLLSRHLFSYLGSGFGLLSGGAFFFKVGGGLRLNSEGAVRELKYRNPGDKSIGAVSPDVTPAAPILSDVRPVPSHPPTPPPPPTPPSPNPSPRSLSPKFCAKRFSSISRRGLRAWTCRRVKIQGADAGYSNPRASHPEALSLQLIRGVLGALVFEIFRPKSALKPDVFSKIMTPKIAKFFDNWGRGGVRNARGFE